MRIATMIAAAALAAATRCPMTMIFNDHSHMSAVFSPNTADDSVTAPLLKWMLSVKSLLR
jgi:hypothetical protein